MVQCGTHDDYDNPSRVPMITGMPHKHPRCAHGYLTTAFTGAAEAIGKAFTPSPRPLQYSQCSSGSVWIAPWKRQNLHVKWKFQGTPTVV